MNNKDHSEYTDDQEQPLSKTKQKKLMHELQEIGEKLLELPLSVRDQFPLSDKLIRTLDETLRLKKREALRRQKQYIGKVMRDEPDIELIKTKLAELEQAHTLNTRHFKELEQLREKLILGGKEEIGGVIDQYPQVDKQKLRQLVSKAQKEHQQQEQHPSTQHSRALFRFLRELSEQED